MDIFRLHKGTAPILIGMPHTGTHIPKEIRTYMTAEGMAVPDTDWHMDKLYDFAKSMGASLLAATHSRYVVDLNRAPDDEHLYPGQLKTGLCPVETFAGDKIYHDEKFEPGEAEKKRRVKAYWRPYHTALESELVRIKAEHGYALLYDAHSIRSVVPRLFEGELDDLNLGTSRGESCDPAMGDRAFEAAKASGFSSVLNARFVGGYITRTYGDPANDVHAIQMELTWKNYMDETPPYIFLPERAKRLQAGLSDILQAMLDWAEDRYGARGAVAANGG